MKRVPICIFGIIVAMCCVAANAASVCEVEVLSYTHNIENCADGETYRFGTTTFDTCLDCASGVYMVQSSISDSNCSNTATRYTCAKACTDTYISDVEIPTIDGCSAEEIRKFGNTEYRTCFNCSAGYRGVDETVTVPECTNTFTITTCEEIPESERECEEDSDCEPSVLLEITDEGKVLMQAEGWCGGDMKCEWDSEYYYCARGYYGEYGPWMDISDFTCAQCPNGGTTVDYYASSISECYVSAGTKFDDDTGTYEFTENCFYSD
ncbi:MAG: hypothetical protein IJX89_03040 [Alphaproteobacteria bacterium]|nr:hypothetical protein [Alphaproteobacteria bacterium]